MARDEQRRDESVPDADVVPEGAPRGPKTVPDANDSGLTTPPISGWGEPVTGDEDQAESEETPTDPRGH